MYMFMQMMLFIYLFILYMAVFLSVFFVTLLERKILGLIQFRLGPNKIMIKGGFQSLADAIKLLGKGVGGMLMIIFNLIEYNIMPFGMMILMLIFWSIIPNYLGMGNFNGVLLLLTVFSVGVYPIMFGSWFSSSVYSLLGSIRSIAQMISFEVSFIIIIISMLVLFQTSSILDFCIWSGLFYFLIYGFVLVMLFLSMLVELNRTPIDLVEGESELVSGFNTEYYGFKFAMIFLAEYGLIMFMGGLFVCLGLGLVFFSFMWIVFMLFVVFLIIFIRGILPRMRYDKLMEICWVSLLSFSLSNLIMNMGVAVFI